MQSGGHQGHQPATGPPPEQGMDLGIFLDCLQPCTLTPCSLPCSPVHDAMGTSLGVQTVSEEAIVYR